MIAAAVLVFGGLVMLLWNNILPSVLGVGTLTFWQAVGLLVLCRILFGGFRGGRPGGGPHAWQRRKMRQRWMQMSDEDREKFRAEWRERCRRR